VGNGRNGMCKIGMEGIEERGKGGRKRRGGGGPPTF